MSLAKRTSALLAKVAAKASLMVPFVIPAVAEVRHELASSGAGGFGAGH